MARYAPVALCTALISCASDGSIGGPNGDPGADGGPAGDIGPDAGDGDPGDSILGTANECDRAAADWVFCSAFEEGNKDIWDDYDGNPDATNLLMADPGPFALADNHVMRLRVPEGRGGADLVKLLPETHSLLFSRWYIKWEPGYDFDARNHGSGLHAGDRNLLGRSDFRPDGDDWYTAWVEPDPSSHQLYIYSYYRGMCMDCVDPNGACWGDHFPCSGGVDDSPGCTAVHGSGGLYCDASNAAPVLEADRWYCVELMLDGGTPADDAAGAGGATNLWIDGLEIGPWTNLWMRTTSAVEVSILRLSLFHHEEHSVEGVMYDNVVVSTSRVGCTPH